MKYKTEERLHKCYAESKDKVLKKAIKDYLCEIDKELIEIKEMLGIAQKHV